jgi:adenosine deaminase
MRSTVSLALSTSCRAVGDCYDDAPKVELHLHLEGAIPLETLWRLIRRYGGDAAVPDVGALTRRLEYTSFDHFIDTWWWMTGFIRTYADFEEVAADVGADLARQNVVYAEASFSPTDFERHGLKPQQIAAAIRTGLNRAKGTSVVLNCDLVRDTGPERAAATLAAVIEVANDADVRGITIGGSEQLYPPEMFADVYRHAAESGLRLTAHAGEAAGPDSVRGALDTLGVERIGHGVRAVEDPDLLRRLVAEQVPLEVCPTSNVRTGVVSCWSNHPVGTLLDAGANVTVSSDDPTFFHTSVASELRCVAERYRAEPLHLTENAIAASWMTDSERAHRLELVRDWWHNVAGTGAAYG